MHSSVELANFFLSLKEKIGLFLQQIFDIDLKDIFDFKNIIGSKILKGK